ncbi:MAG: hypothetical protein ABI318_07470, partial [Chthoniobacteraceae bacterium]
LFSPGTENAVVGSTGMRSAGCSPGGQFVGQLLDGFAGLFELFERQRVAASAMKGSGRLASFHDPFRRAVSRRQLAGVHGEELIPGEGLEAVAPPDGFAAKMCRGVMRCCVHHGDLPSISNPRGISN